MKQLRNDVAVAKDRAQKHNATSVGVSKLYTVGQSDTFDQILLLIDKRIAVLEKDEKAVPA